MVQLQHQRRKAMKMTCPENIKADFLSPAEVGWPNNPGSMKALMGREGEVAPMKEPEETTLLKTSQTLTALTT